MKEYSILWIDDQHNDPEMVQFKIRAEQEGLLLEGYASFEEAESVLDEKLHLIDSVLLDGMFFEKKSQIAGTEDELGIGAAIAKLNELKSRKKMPWFVLSGKEQFTKGNSLLKANKADCYDKTNPDDLDRLFKAIKAEADKQIDTQIRHNHSSIFEIFTKGNLSQDEELQVLNLLKLELDNDKSNIKAALSNIRSIHESIFAKLEQINVISEGLSTNNKLRSLSGSYDRTKGTTTTTVHQNSSIENLQKFVHFTCSNYIHNLSKDHYNDYMISAYTVEALRAGLLEILLWFDQIYENNK